MVSLLTQPFKNIMKAIGIILIIVGILMLVFRGFNYTKEKNIADIGPLEINAKEKKSVSWPLYAGGIAVIAGVVFLLMDKKRD